MQVHGYTSTGSISATIEDQLWDIPDDMSSRFRQMIAEWEKEGNVIPAYVAPEEPTAYRLYKTTLWVRMTDEEAETVMSAKGTQPAKFRGIWDDAQTIESDSEFFGVLKQFLSAALNPARAESLLQPED